MSINRALAERERKKLDKIRAWLNQMGTRKYLPRTMKGTKNVQEKMESGQYQMKSEFKWIKW